MSGKINLVLTALLVACGLSLVNAQYQARHLFIELERTQSQARQLDSSFQLAYRLMSSPQAREEALQRAHVTQNFLPDSSPPSRPAVL